MVYAFNIIGHAARSERRPVMPWNVERSQAVRHDQDLFLPEIAVEYVMQLQGCCTGLCARHGRWLKGERPVRRLIAATVS